MTVEQLIEMLLNMPKDLPVQHSHGFGLTAIQQVDNRDNQVILR